MLKQKQLTRLGLTVIAVMGIGLMPMLAGSAAVGSVAGSRNATLSGEALVPNTTVFSGDNLQVKDGVAVVALEAGNRMVFGRETEASFLREAKAVTVLLSRGDVSLYHPGENFGVRVKAGDVTVSPAAGYKTLGEVAMRDGSLVVTAKQGMLQVERQGRTEQVGVGKTMRLPVKAAGAPVPNPAGPPDGNPHITTANTLGVLTLGAGTAAAVLAGLDLSRTNDAKAAANAAETAANNATAAANAAGAAANAAGCALNNLNPLVTPSPYEPPSGYSCP
jgi:hypothetical protein